MKYTLKISVSKQPRTDGIVAFRHINVRERIMRMLFGASQKLTILVPGDSVEELSIREVKEGVSSKTAATSNLRCPRLQKRH